MFQASSLVSSQIGFGIIADQSLGIFGVERFAVEPYFYAARFGLAHDLVVMDLVARKLAELVEYVRRNQMSNLFKGYNQGGHLREVLQCDSID
jgi:hypothetical protein